MLTSESTIVLQHLDVEISDFKIWKLKIENLNVDHLKVEITENLNLKNLIF